jgi:membrane protein YqaA with SNARE-associated domain
MRVQDEQDRASSDEDADPAAQGWLRRIVEARSAQLALFWFSFLEATILPIPVETVMTPYMQMRRDILWRIATIALAGFMTSALLGYFLGALFFDTLGEPLIARMGWNDEFARVQGVIGSDGFLAMLLIGLTPVPTQVAMIGAGSLEVPIPQFIAAMLIARSIRYYGVGLLVYFFGDRVVRWFTPRKPRAGHPPLD